MLDFSYVGRNYEAHRSLRWLRGPNYSEAQIEMEFQILKESYADQIKSSQQSHEQESSSFKR